MGLIAVGPSRTRRGRAVLWGARKYDWQVGGAYDLARQPILKGVVAIQFAVADHLTPVLRKTARALEEIVKRYA